ncbi:hypothetical protein K3495_g16132, partial [Podosphaera aphanis]
MEDNDGFNISKLSGDNHEAWFRMNKIKLRGKQCFFVCEKSLQEYAKSDGVEGIIEKLTDFTFKDEGGRFRNVKLNVDKKTTYEVAEAKAISILFASLSEDDQALIDEYETAFSFWAHLKSKYSSTDATTANKYMTAIQTFSFGMENASTIATAWDKLKDFRRKLINANSKLKETYPDEGLFLVLIRALPSSYGSTVDTLNILLGMSIDEKLKHLQEKERRLVEENPEEQANPAFRNEKKG